MATRIDSSVGSGDLSGLDLLSYLRSRTVKNSEAREFIGLKRSEALSDLSDRGEALNNILAKLSVLDVGETERYNGPFNANDWLVTRDFIDNQFDKDFLSTLAGVSTGSITPRTLIQDVIGQANSFYGEGSFSGLHNGPDAQFYRSAGSKHIGFVSFEFDPITLNVTTLSVKGVDGVTNLNPVNILGSETVVVLDVTGYGAVPLSGSGIALKLESGNLWSIESGLANLIRIQSSLPSGEFESLLFKIERPYSRKYLPLWFSESPADSSESVPGSADDNNPATSSKVFVGKNGQTVPNVARSYWYTKSYVEDRWSEGERTSVGKFSIVEDSNMRWISPPDQLKGETTNWGIRWDGYLRILPGTYSFSVQTNVLAKIDMDIDTDWVNVFNTSTATLSGADTYTSATFNTNNVRSSYKYFTGGGVNDWIGYVPITIRMFHGGPDKAYPEETVPSSPDIFIKTVKGSEIESLWKTRIASTGPDGYTYSYLTGGSYVPDLNRIPFDQLPEWWKVSGGNPYVLGLDASQTNTPLDGWLNNEFKAVLKSDAEGVGLYGNGSGVYSNRPNLILGEAKYSVTDNRGSNYIGFRLTPSRLGEGGRLIINALPVNNSTFTGINTLGANDLGGDPNHKTIAFANTSFNIIRLYLWSNPTTPSVQHYNKYFTVQDITTISSNEDPTIYGLPNFSSSVWISPLTVSATQVADDSEFTTNVRGFVAPLTLSVEKISVNGYNVLAFSTTLQSILNGDDGSEISDFSSKYVKIYTENNIAFQFGFVDNGEGLSFSDTLKITYDSGVFNPTQSEVPSTSSSRVTPFGYDLPEYSTGLCYPPYSTINPLLSDTAVDDTTLYSSAVGNYDVFWGNPYENGLGNDVLTITEKMEFFGSTAVEVLPSPVSIPYSSYTHRIKIDMPLLDTYDEDVLEYLGNGEKVKDSYYAYVKLN